MKKFNFFSKIKLMIEEANIFICAPKKENLVEVKWHNN